MIQEGLVLGSARLPAPAPVLHLPSILELHFKQRKRIGRLSGEPTASLDVNKRCKLSVSEVHLLAEMIRSERCGGKKECRSDHAPSTGSRKGGASGILGAVLFLAFLLPPSGR